MSFNFGQFRRSQVSNYLTPISYDIIDLKTVSAASAAMFFADKAISLSVDNPLISVNENNIQQSYFLRVKIYKRKDSNQIITIKLNNTDKISDNIQNIRQIEIPKGEEEEYTTFEIVISPNNNYDEIQFILSREALDYSIFPEEGSDISGRVIKIEVDNLSLIYNVLDYLRTAIDNKGRLKQIGVQGPAGLLMNINGESIRIGRTGIYEINNGVTISSIGFIIEDGNIDNFILDYQY
jgi:hypothetical protein